MPPAASQPDSTKPAQEPEIRQIKEANRRFQRYAKHERRMRSSRHAVYGVASIWYELSILDLLRHLRGHN